VLRGSDGAAMADWVKPGAVSCGDYCLFAGLAESRYAWDYCSFNFAESRNWWSQSRFLKDGFVFGECLLVLWFKFKFQSIYILCSL